MSYKYFSLSNSGLKVIYTIYDEIKYMKRRRVLIALAFVSKCNMIYLIAFNRSNTNI